MRQYKLESVTEPINGKCKRENIFKICWLDADLHPGNIIDLKDYEGYWVIDEAYDQYLEKHEIKRGWKVGGL